MLIGQNLGPFKIEKELGSGAMGTVYRAVYQKTGKRVAVKIMSPSLGTNERALARFEREGEILKQLKHPNIVRLFGVGRHGKSPYYAMEYIEGESLDQSMARRDRLTWEELVTLGKQLCDALFHAHQKGIVHRDLKPSNLMVLRDGTVKLTDFGIAKDLDVTQLTSANCTVGTAAYMSPEQCRGERDLTFKSDLYSMGVMFYELLVGKKPFNAENAMDMFLQHVQGTFERPSRRVLDIPIWLDTLVCQLLEKKPEHRPRDAAMVAEVLDSIAAKVAAQQSAGADAAARRFVDRDPTSARPDKGDKEVAKLLLNGKFKVRRRKKVVPFYQRKWLQALGILLALAGGIALIVIAVLPPPADKLVEQARAVMESGDLDKMMDARDKGPLSLYARHYPDDPDQARKKQMSDWKDDVDASLRQDQLQKKIARARRQDQAFKPENDSERLAQQALAFEEFGDVVSAGQRWIELNSRNEKDPEDFKLVLLAHKKWRELKDRMTPDPAAARLEFLRKRLDEVKELRESDKPTRAEQLWKEITTLYKDLDDPAVQQLIKDATPQGG